MVEIKANCGETFSKVPSTLHRVQETITISKREEISSTQHILSKTIVTFLEWYEGDPSVLDQVTTLIAGFSTV
jgi:hypothetical protein